LRGHALLEIPITTFVLGGHNLPCGGGGYFRLLPRNVCHWGIRRVNEKERKAAVFYFHPWEIDPEQPRIDGASAKARFRHYTNLKHMQRKLEKTLSRFAWDRMDRVFGLGAAGER
jgi:polysaccharide deacetylase family protein (PEP-CTERM system associated)